MNWIEILRLIVQIWPLIEKILDMISNAEERDTAVVAVKRTVADLIDGTTPVSTPDDVVAVLSKPLRLVA